MNPYALTLIENQTEAIESNPHALNYVRDQTHEICFLNIQYNPQLIQNIIDPNTRIVVKEQLKYNSIKSARCTQVIY